MLLTQLALAGRALEEEEEEEEEALLRAPVEVS
jgi:hypothetical protein